MRRATVDLPQPDSPTRPTVSPLSMSSDTWSTARRMRRGSWSSTRLSQGGDTSKSRLTPSSLSSGMQPAGGEAGARRHEVRTLVETALEPPNAARMERAARRDGIEARHGAIDLHQATALGRDARNGAHQADRIGMFRRMNHVAHAAHLDDA